MGKGGSTTSQEIPYWLEDAARRNLNQADRISRIGAVPMSYGPTVAAFTPMQNSSFLNTANAASAFGLDAPTGTDITGGLPAPTNYGGVTGYSAKPVFDAITGEFREDRPGQASYIDSFFINPFTGTTGINAGNVSGIGYQNTTPVGVDGQPIVGGSNSGGVGQERADFMADHMARQKMNYAKAAQDAGDNILNYGQDDRGGVYAIGYGGNTISPAKADEIGLTIKNKNPFDMTFGEHVGQIRSDVSNMKDQVVDDVKGVAKDGTVMCSAYCKMGYLPKEIWKLDRRYGVKVLREDPALIQGYHLWGIPTANYIQKNTLLAKTLRSVMWPIVKAWAEEMAHCMQPEKYKPNYVGKAIKLVGEPFSRLCGKIYKYQIRLSRTVKEI
tara:strand:+ start:3382 stop:4536 length:1155 start_codon:yes stop_codon:yes gene_type:complete